MLNAGITFTVYSDAQSTERIFPFSLIPRIITAGEWAHIEAGLIQRVRALNMFLEDIYNDQTCVAAGVLPGEIALGSPGFREQMLGFVPPLGIYAHIAGCDLVRDGNGQFVVLEDNLRTPSGVSYVIENRSVMRRIAPELFPPSGVLPVGDYPSQLLATLQEVAPARAGSSPPVVAVLTPGIFNSAYFEHAFLSQQMGVHLVEGSDLLVSDDDIVYVRSTSGLERVDVLYRRVDDEYLDPDVFLSDSLLGVPGLMRAFRAGTVTVVNAPGAGVADDKVVYRFVPDLIRFFLKEEPLLANVETYAAAVPSELEYIREHASELVLKPANASGGYGIVIGPQATAKELEDAVAAIESNPRDWIAQPLLEFSTIPTIIDGEAAPRRADVRPFVLSGRGTWVLPGGLTRVALREGSYIVNSSQGGGSKDTWVLSEVEADA